MRFFEKILKSLEVPLGVNDVYFNEGYSRWGNRDVYPIISKERTYTWSSYLGYYFTSGFSATSWTLGSGLLAYGLTAGQACGAVAIGSMIASINAFLCGQAGSDHHVNYAMLSRTALGLYGSYLSVIICVFESLIYFGLQSYFGGQAIVVILNSLFPKFLHLRNTLSENAGITTQALIGFLLYFIIYFPIIFVKPYKLEKFLIPSILITICSFAGVLGWAIHRNGGPGNLVSSTIEMSPDKNGWRFVQGICSVAGTYTGGTIRMSDWTRFEKQTRSALPSMLIAYPVSITATALVGVLVTSATNNMYGQVIWNPLLIVQYVQNVEYTAACRAGSFFAGIGFLSSQIFVNLTQNTIASGMEVAGLFPKYINLVRGACGLTIIGVLIQPWRFLTQARTFISVLSTFGVFFGPLTAILVVDYWIIRSRKWIIPDLYKADGIYWYTAGLNWKAFLTFFFTIIWSMPGLVNAVTNAPMAQPWIQIFQMNWFFGFPLGCVMYYGLSTAFPPIGLGIQEDMNSGLITMPSTKQDLTLDNEPECRGIS